jgi:endo-1,4-beta-xylanase
MPLISFSALFIAVILVGCIAPAGTTTPTTILTTPPSPSASESPPQNLALDSSWISPNVTINGSRLIFTTTDKLIAPTNRTGPHLEFTGDFTVTTTFEIAKLTTDYTAWQLTGALATGEWWHGLKRLDVAIRQGRVDINMYTGNVSTAVMTKSFPFPDLTPKVQVVVSKSAQGLSVTVNDKVLGPLDDPVLFNAGVVYFGFQVPPNNQLTVYNLAVLAPPTAASIARIVGTPVVVTPHSKVPGTLQDIAQSRGILIGSEVGGERDERADTTYWNIASQEFSIWTINQYYFAVVHPQPDQYNFTYGDFLVQQAQTNGIKIRGHTLIWHNSLPDWISKGTFTRDQLMAIMKDHIQTVVGRYRGKIYAWDVVNEAVNDDGSLRPTIWEQVIGPDYLDMAFQWAHEADPQAKLFYNDYNAEGLGKKSDGVYELVKQLKARGVPIDGVGLQMHLTEGKPVPPSDLEANIQRLGALGLEVEVTEMDVRIHEPADQNKLASQAQMFHDVLSACLTVPAFKAFVMWGFTDKYSWVPNAAPGYGDATIFDTNFTPKPAYQGLKDALLGK